MKIGMADSVLDSMLKAARVLADGVDALEFGSPTEVVYNPLRYAWAAHEQYLRLHAAGKKTGSFSWHESRAFWDGAMRGAFWRDCPRARLGGGGGSCEATAGSSS
jgi:hypothetical protein